MEEDKFCVVTYCYEVNDDGTMSFQQINDNIGAQIGSQ